MHQAQERDEWLMAQVADGKREHLEPLIRRYANPLLTFIRRMVGDQHRSEELFQDVFLAVWVKRRQYAFPRPFKSWLYAIAVNKCRASFRGQAPPAFLAEAGNLATPPATREPSPVEKMVATETAALVANAVELLPPQQRAVVVLRVWDGLSYAEIAEIVVAARARCARTCTTAWPQCESTWNRAWSEGANHAEPQRSRAGSCR
jgi:RNA polymerase sigma-70 factor, ECF subfamily